MPTRPSGSSAAPTSKRRSMVATFVVSSLIRATRIPFDTSNSSMLCSKSNGRGSNDSDP